MKKIYEKLSLSGAAVTASSVDMAAFNSWSIIDGLPAKETFIGGSIVSAIGFIGLTLEYRRLVNIQLPPDPDDPSRENVPDEEQNGELIPFPVEEVVIEGVRRAA